MMDETTNRAAGDADERTPDTAALGLESASELEPGLEDAPADVSESPDGTAELELEVSAESAAPAEIETPPEGETALEVETAPEGDTAPGGETALEIETPSEGEVPPEAAAPDSGSGADFATDRLAEAAAGAEQDAEPSVSEVETAFAAEGIPATETSPASEPGQAPEASPPIEAAPPTEPAVAPEPEMIPVGRQIARMLHGAGIRWAFTVPGESFLGLLDELTDAGIHVVGARHEGGASFMAEAVGQLTGRPALCLATRAVGGANLAIGIHTARADSTPLVAVIGQVPRDVRGREAFQEADLATSIGGLAKWAAEATTAVETPRLVADGLHQALSGRPGPVVLSLPEDLLDEPIEAVAPTVTNTGPASRPDPVVVRSILRMLADAERPVILAGAGVLRARCSTDLTRLAEFLRVPVIASWRRGDVIANDHPLYLGMTGYGAPAIVHERLEAADAVLVLGSRLNEITTSGYRIPRPGQRWAHVDLEPRGSSAGVAAPEIALAADARAFVRAALERLRGAALDAVAADGRDTRNGADRVAWEAATIVDGGEWDGPGVHPGRVVGLLRRVLPDDAIVTTDAGNMSGWLARGFRFHRPGTFLGPTSGAMGYGLPAAIAAALVHRDRTVVAWTGDGGFAMSMAELETAVRMHLRLVVIVLDNERYGTIRMHQDQRGVPAPVATDLGPIDFAAVARGLGAHGSRPSTEAELEVALRAALVSDRPTVIQLALDRRWVSVDRPAV
jgi:acetolactate synthase-1/2/3 large subunit